MVNLRQDTYEYYRSLIEEVRVICRYRCLTKFRPLVLEGVEKRFAQGIEKGIEKGLLLEAQ
jgi:hypothetical protein